MNWKHLKLTISLVLLLGCAACGGERTLLPGTSLVPKSNVGGRNDLTFLCRLDDGSLGYFDPAEDLRVLRLRRPGGFVKEFNSEHLRGHFGWKKQVKCLGGIVWTPEKDKWFKKEPVLFSVTNVKPYKDGVILIRNEGHRVVQYLDRNLRVTSFWYDRVPRISFSMRAAEPIAVLEQGGIVATGEKGEILVYDPSGKIKKRLVMRGLFNEERIVKLKPMTPDEERIYGKNPILRRRWERRNRSAAERSTREVLARDNVLPKPVFLAGEELPERIRFIEGLEDGSIFIMDEQLQFFTLDLAKAEIAPLSIKGLEFEEKEDLMRVQVKKDFLFLATVDYFRAIDLGKKSLVLRKTTPGDLCPHSVSWDAIVEKGAVTIYSAVRKKGKLKKIVFSLP